jgi:hypothetical protein
MSKMVLNGLWLTMFGFTETNSHFILLKLNFYKILNIPNMIDGV